MVEAPLRGEYNVGAIRALRQAGGAAGALSSPGAAAGCDQLALYLPWLASVSIDLRMRSKSRENL